jgi:hypothetical protein
MENTDGLNNLTEEIVKLNKTVKIAIFIMTIIIVFILVITGSLIWTMSEFIWPLRDKIINFIINHA